MESDNRTISKSDSQINAEAMSPPLQEIKKDIETNSTPSQPIPNNIIANANNTIISSLFISKGRVNDLDLIWKLQIKKEQFMSSFMQFQIVKSRDNKDNYIGIVYFFYNKSMSGSLIFLYQNCLKGTEEEFKEEMKETFNRLKTNQEIKEKDKEDKAEDNNKDPINLIGDLKGVSQSPSHANRTYSNCNAQYSNSQESRPNSLEDLRVEESNNNNNNTQSNAYVDNTQIDHALTAHLNNNNENNNPMIDDDLNNTISDNNFQIDYDISLQITLIDIKYQNGSYKSLHSQNIIYKEMQLTSINLMSLEEESILVIELKRSKNYPKSTEYNGLINEGMTCYMNSMIQSLNVLGYFKKGVFMMPFEGFNTVAYSLQRLFYELKFENDLASTNKLIESFGWSRDLIFVQHDVQEFNMMLSDLMEQKMKGTKAEGSFKYLFEGKILNCIQCLDYDYTSKKEEIFNDLQLTVKGCRNIYESLNKFTEEEIMDNEDMYLVEGHGKEKAKKTLKFLSLPPVLIFQLKRFEYNPKKNEMDKVNDYFEFGTLLDMSAYIPNEQKDNAQYALISIVVHRGNVHGGHYYSFIRNSIDNDDWYCFNDEIVRKADLYEVLNINYGGTFTLYRHREKGFISELHPSSDQSAYILIYIKVNQAQNLLKPITIEDIPKDIISAIHADKEREREEMLLMERKEKYMNIYLLSNETLSNYKGIGLARGNAKITLDPITYEDPDYLTVINVPRKLMVSQLYEAFKSIYNCKEIDLFLFCLKNPNRITKRNEYSMHHLSKMYFDFELSELLYEANENIKLVKRVYIYICAPFPSLKMSKYTLTEEISYKFQCNQQEFVFFVPKTNRYEFNKEGTISNVPSEQNEMQDKFLFVIKRFDFNKNALEIADILLIKRNKASLLKVHTALALKYYKNQFKANNDLANKQMKIVYLIENTSIHCNNTNTEDDDDEDDIEDEEDNNLHNAYEELNKLIQYNEHTLIIEDNSFIDILYDFAKLFKDNPDNDCFIIIPYVYYEDQNEANTIPYLDQINTLYSIYKYTVMIPLHYNPSFSYLSMKMSTTYEFYLNQSEDSIKQRVFNTLSQADLVNMLSIEKESANNNVFTRDKQLISISDYCKLLTKDNINLRKKVNSESSELPLLKYIGNFAKQVNEIEFEILTIPDKDREGYCQFLVSLIDANYNIIGDIDIHLPCDLSLVSEVIEYIYEPILKDFYPGDLYTKEEYLMLLHFPSKDYMVNSISPKANLKEYSKVASPIIKYSIMPMREQTDDKLIIRVAFKNSINVTLCQSIFFFEPEDVLVSKVKADIIEKIQRINKLINNDTIDCTDIKKIKFYTYSNLGYDLIKEMLILNNKDNEKLLALYKPSTYGLLIEFLPKDK